jgi:hypothetical protein
VGHIEGLIASIPGPFSLSAGHWDEDPLIHALFEPDEIRSLLHNCAELKSFFQKRGGQRRCTPHGNEKGTNCFRTALEGEIIRRDVLQVAVEFYDHRLAAPVATEPESRRELLHRGLKVLATYALEEMMQIQSVREELTEQRRILAIKLKIQKTRERGFEGLLAGGSQANPDAMQAEQVLSKSTNSS